MNYNSYAFWALFAAVFALYWRLDHKKQNRLLLGASYVFYGTWDYRFLFLILLSTVIDFVGGLGVAGVRLPRGRLRALGALLVASALLLCGGSYAIPLAVAVAVLAYGRVLPLLHALPEPRRRKAFLVISLAANLAILGFFKYCDFFVGGARSLFALAGLGDPGWPLLHVLLPVGISFYTFQAMSYTVDIYRGEIAPTDDFADFALFVCFFPHLVAGPIMRAHTLLPQVVSPRPDPRGTAMMQEGLALVLIGLFKKLVIADNCAALANAVFLRRAEVSGLEALLGVYAFACQIYGDFSGYSAIARGISKWLGFELVVNFDLPYLATTPSDFWRRWHISLSSWLRDYLYIPLGGNRGGVLRSHRNLLVTMALGGLWHGASVTFVIWGLYHGLLLIVFKALAITEVSPRQTLRWLARVFVMFHLTCLGWLFFRADSFAIAAHLLRLIATELTPGPRAAPMAVELALFGLLPLALDVLIGGERRLHRLRRTPWPVQTLGYAYLLAMLVFLHAGQAHEFIYFQF
jgi:alginate O-acetyltransferase complex protein AlgI